jgi:glycosyltransferase involved in cell wall biosynthesis
MGENVRLSIITINRNNKSGLEKTIGSVVCQTFSDYEYIVIDGASDDGSVDIIKKYAPQITYWVSEPDTGIYNAMNKGILKARGDYCLFLNSADFLIEKETLKNVFMEIDATERVDVYYSDCLYSDGRGDVYPDAIDTNFLINYMVNHQNTLTRRALFIEYGLYNEKFRITADRDFFIRAAYLHHVQFRHIETPISVYDTTGLSNTVDFDDEIDEIIEDVFGEIAPPIIKLHRDHTHLDEIVIQNIKHREGLGMRFILRCIRAWFSRDKIEDIISKKV